MIERYPNEWLFVIDLELDQSLNLLSGVVLAHDRDKKCMYQQASVYDMQGTFSSTEYTGNLIPEPWRLVVSALKEKVNMS